MDGVLVQEPCKEGLSLGKIFAENTLTRRERGRFFAKPLVGPILLWREARKYLCSRTEMLSIRFVEGDQIEEKVTRKARRKMRVQVVVI